MISIIIVHYKVPKALLLCLQSIIASNPKVPYEIIVVDNDEEPTIKSNLHKKFPKVIYIKNASNVGFGSANNIGAKKAKGKYLFFLNPDTLLYKQTMDALISFIKDKKDAGIVAPLLLDTNEKPYTQGTQELTPFRAIFALTFLAKLFPFFSQRYYFKEWDKKSIKEVAVAPGTAFVIEKSIFEKVGGFDEKFFLYFEEFDLCKRVRALGYKIFIIPNAKVQHIWGLSTKQKEDKDEIFNKSRFYYFKKHYGLFKANLVEVFFKINKYTLTLILSLLLGLFLSAFKIHDLMPFIGDYAWFYISARDVVTEGALPLVGIASSHPWLHQGALWTYMLAPVLWGFSFDPVSGAYLTILFFIATIVLMYKVGSAVFSKSVGAIAALLYATSPLIVTHARSPYHTSPIPFFCSNLFLFFASMG